MAQQTSDFKELSKKLLDDKGQELVKVGSRIMLRTYGSTQHFELTSESAGTDGNVIVYEDDIKELRDFLNAFHPELCRQRELKPSASK